LHNMGDRPDAADAFRLWNKSAGPSGKVVNASLVSRREKERDIYLNGYSSSGHFPVPPSPATPFPAEPSASSGTSWPSTIATTAAPNDGARFSPGALAALGAAFSWLFYRLIHR